MVRRYVAIRTDKSEKPFILRELEQGRLRQGWGTHPRQDLRKLRAKVDAGKDLDDDEAAAWRNRRMLEAEHDGLRPGDIAILPNLPHQGHWVIVRVAGPYSYEPLKVRGNVEPDYGHTLSVQPIRDASGKLAIVEADNEHVDARLRASMRNMSRMWSLDGYRDAIERLIVAIDAGEDITKPQPELQKAESFFEEMRKAAWTAIRERYKGAEFEDLVRRLFEQIYAGGRVERWGGAGEKGADLIVFTRDPLDLEYKIAVQVKLFDGMHDDPHALAQIRQARNHHRVDAGVVVTTAVETSPAFEAKREALEAELGIDVRVITRDDFVRLVMEFLGGSRAMSGGA